MARQISERAPSALAVRLLEIVARPFTLDGHRRIAFLDDGHAADFQFSATGARGGDSVYGDVFIRRLRAMGIRDRPTAPRSPWQNGYCERLIGSIRRECLDHVVVFGERHLRHLLRSYGNYYNQARTHLSLNKDAPGSRAIQTVGRILPLPILGGLHHRYVRI